MIDKLVCLIGESGSGKTTIAQLLGKDGLNYFDNNDSWITTEQYKNKGTTIYVVNPDSLKSLKRKVKDVKIIVIYLKTDINTRIKRMLQREDRFLVQTQYYSIYSKILEKAYNDVDTFDIVQCDYIINANKNKYEVLANVKSILDDILCE